MTALVTTELRSQNFRDREIFRRSGGGEGVKHFIGMKMLVFLLKQGSYMCVFSFQLLFHSCEIIIIIIMVK